MKSQLKNDVYIIEGLRTAIGSPFKSLKKFTVPELAGSVVKALLRKTKINKTAIDEVFIGNVVGAGLGQNLARQVAITGGLPVTVPALTINNVCGAGLQTVILAARSLVTDNARVILCGGVESATHNPYYFEGDIEQSFNPHDVKDSLIHDGLICAITKKHMGELAEAMAKRHHISRDDQDLYALQSHLKAVRAQDNKIFVEEIVPLKIGPKQIFRDDERPRRKISIENFKTLRPAFARGGTVTAGNASAPADGAAACLLASKAGVKACALKPKARLIAEATIAVDPNKSFEACVQAVRAVIKSGGLSKADIDCYEIGESFAAQGLITQRKLRLPASKVNIYGGDLAFGHPLGAAGMRALVTLVTALGNRGGRFGVVAIAYGGGGATALLVERIDKI